MQDYCRDFVTQVSNCLSVCLCSCILSYRTNSAVNMTVAYSSYNQFCNPRLQNINTWYPEKQSRRWWFSHQLTGQFTKIKSYLPLKDLFFSRLHVQKVETYGSNLTEFRTVKLNFHIVVKSARNVGKIIVSNERH